MAVFSKVSAGLAQISETSRFRDRDKTETLAIRDQDQGAETRDLQKMVLRPRPRPRPGLETTTLKIIHKSVNQSVKILILDLYLHYDLFICQNIIVKLTGIS